MALPFSSVFMEDAEFRMTSSALSQTFVRFLVSFLEDWGLEYLDNFVVVNCLLRGRQCRFLINGFLEYGANKFNSLSLRYSGDHVWPDWLRPLDSLAWENGRCRLLVHEAISLRTWQSSLSFGNSRRLQCSCECDCIFEYVFYDKSFDITVA